jgi:hypothetical protein
LPFYGWVILEVLLHLYGLAILTSWLAWTDWRHGQLSIFGLFLLMVLGLAGSPEVIPALVLGIVALVCWRLGYCGSGDIYLLLACGLWVPLALLPYFCSLAGIFVFVVGLRRKNPDQHGFPLAPPLLLALWVVVCCEIACIKVSMSLNPFSL